MTDCYFCGQAEKLALNAAHWVGDRETGHWERIDVCSAPECRKQIRSYPRKPKAKKNSVKVPATDYNMLCAFVNPTQGKKVKK